MVLSDTEACEKALQEYRDAVQPILYELNQLLEKATPAWKAYAPRSSSLPESMSDGEYHEYTLAFPAEDPVGHDFYFPRMVEKSRVEMFVKQPRMESIQDLLSDAGFQEQWIDMEIKHEANCYVCIGALYMYAVCYSLGSQENRQFAARGFCL